ncbi:dihydroorotate dehydrogenase [Candidatus Micrarchaeota archaeon]|nr:dihydroorotate dehydrogenase [Candidatus Micrarchaeota archaeon]
MAKLKCEFFGKKLKNPIILASGVLGMTKASLEMACENGCGGVTTKSLSIEPRKGHEGPNVAETECGFMNAMGYPNPGIDAGLKEFDGWKRDEALIISIVGKDATEFGTLAEKVEEAKLNAAAIEVVLSCPHTPGYGTMVGQGSPESVTEICKTVKEKTKIPLIVKLSPSVPGEVKAAEAAKNAGADAINMGNSLGPAMKIDIHRKMPVLGFGMGGLSGPAIKPIAIRCIYAIKQTVDIPIIGTGGVNCGTDAIEMMMAGANWISVGTAVYYRGPEAFDYIAREMDAWMDMYGYKNVNEIVGVVHEEIRKYKNYSQ